MYEEDYSDDLYEYGEDGEYLSDVCHIEEYTENVERKQGNDGRIDGLDDDLFEIV